MRLSEAIALGRVLIDRPNGGSYCMCAIGMGLAADGEEYHLQNTEHNSDAAYKKALQKWPWLAQCGSSPFLTYESEISSRFWRVALYDESLDQLIDWVRSVEPPEPATLPSAEDLDALAEEREIAEATSVSSHTEPLLQSRLSHQEVRAK